MNNLIHENIIRFCVPIPFPLRDVNMYALVGKDGWALIDTGIGMPDTRATFHAKLQQAGLSINDLRTIVLTHHHPDHIGLSGELQAQSGAQVYMHSLDEATLQSTWSHQFSERHTESLAFFQQHGLSAVHNGTTQMAPETMQTIIHVPPHTAFTFIKDGQSIDLVGEDYRVLWTPGHSDGQICLFRERDGVFLSADHVLPRVTPNIGLYSLNNRENPLRDYLDALIKVSTLPAHIVLPGHGEPFAQLAKRISEIVAHHEQRLAHILHLLATQPQHAYQITEQFFGARLKNNDAWRMAAAEVIAHLEYLRFARQIDRYYTEEGVFLYTIKKVYNESV